MQAAVGLAQLDRLDGFIAARRRNFNFLKQGLRGYEDSLILPEATPGTEPSWFGFPITLRANAPVTRDQLAQHLNARKIGTRLLFGGNLVRQPYMKGRDFRISGTLTNADIVVDSTFWIGVYPGLGEPQLDYVIEAIGELVRPPARRTARR